MYIHISVVPSSAFISMDIALTCTWFDKNQTFLKSSVYIAKNDTIYPFFLHLRITKHKVFLTSSCARMLRTTKHKVLLTSSCARIFLYFSLNLSNTSCVRLFFNLLF